MKKTNTHFLLFFKNRMEGLVIPITNKSVPLGVVVGSWTGMATRCVSYTLYFETLSVFSIKKTLKSLKLNCLSSWGITKLRRIINTSSDFKAQHFV